jgi:hypothetical protein
VNISVAEEEPALVLAAVGKGHESSNLREKNRHIVGVIPLCIQLARCLIPERKKKLYPAHAY